MSKCLLVSMLALAAVAGSVATASAAGDRDHDGLPDRWEKKHKLKNNQQLNLYLLMMLLKLKRHQKKHLLRIPKKLQLSKQR